MTGALFQWVEWAPTKRQVERDEMRRGVSIGMNCHILIKGLIRSKVATILMQHFPALLAIESSAGVRPVLDRNLQKPEAGTLWGKIVKGSPDMISSIRSAMVNTKSKARGGLLAQETGLLWPLERQWSGGFVFSENAGRDFEKFAIAALVEDRIVGRYRQATIDCHYTVGKLRFALEEYLGEKFVTATLSGEVKYKFSDPFAVEDTEPSEDDPSVDDLIREIAIQGSMTRYLAELNEINRFMAKKTIMYATPIRQEGAVGGKGKGVKIPKEAKLNMLIWRKYVDFMEVSQSVPLVL